MATRRQFLSATAYGALASFAAFAQSRPVRVGMLSARPLSESFFAANVVTRLGELGWRQGRGMTLEFRSAPALEDYAKRARELADLGCDLLFAIGPEHAARYFRGITRSTPVVFLAVDYDPVDKGIVASLARPGSNTTGVYIPQAELAAKRLDILRELVPGARRFVVLVDSFSSTQLPAVRQAAQTAGVQLAVIEFKTPPYDFEAAFAQAAGSRVEGYVELASPVFGANARQLSALLRKFRLPGAHVNIDVVIAGSLLSYGPDPRKVAHRTAELGVRVLKAGKADGIPVEQADQFELVINSTTAATLGVKIPERILARATRIIQ